MSLIVHAVSGAPRPWRVLIALAFKNLDYDLRYLEASKGEHKSAEFLQLNPRGTVPVLEADGLILRDSIGILAWLDRQFPSHPLFGDSALEAGEIWQVVLECNDYLRAAHNDVFFPILVQGKPIPDRDTTEGKMMHKAADRLRHECDRLEQLLDNGAFLYGDAPTAADAVVYPDIRLVQRGMDTKPEQLTALGLQTLWSDYPRLGAWKDRIEALPGMEKTMPPHWIN